MKVNIKKFSLNTAAGYRNAKTVILLEIILNAFKCLILSLVLLKMVAPFLIILVDIFC